MSSPPCSTSYPHDHSGLKRAESADIKAVEAMPYLQTLCQASPQCNPGKWGNIPSILVCISPNSPPTRIVVLLCKRSCGQNENERAQTHTHKACSTIDHHSFRFPDVHVAHTHTHAYGGIE
eukprot:m.5193 g.5193  ORF g.5193 m.5193 type:complete len:121 (-) comp4858_c1_seq1:330-692(-)